MMNVSVECIRGKKGNIFELEILKSQEFKKLKKFKIPILHLSNIKEKLKQEGRIVQKRMKRKSRYIKYLHKGNVRK